MYESEVSSPVSDVSALCAVGVRHRASSGRVCECFEAGRHECARTDGMEAGLCFTRPDGGGMLTDTHFVVMGLCGAMLGIGAAALLWRRRSRQVCSIAKQKKAFTLPPSLRKAHHDSTNHMGGGANRV